MTTKTTKTIKTSNGDIRTITKVGPKSWYSTNAYGRTNRIVWSDDKDAMWVRANGEWVEVRYYTYGFYNQNVNHNGVCPKSGALRAIEIAVGEQVETSARLTEESERELARYDRSIAEAEAELAEAVEEYTDAETENVDAHNHPDCFEVDASDLRLAEAERRLAEAKKDLDYAREDRADFLLHWAEYEAAKTYDIKYYCKPRKTWMRFGTSFDSIEKADKFATELQRDYPEVIGDYEIVGN